MKNRDILLDVIGDTDGKLIPGLNAENKKNRRIKWIALGSVCAAAVIACVAVLPKMSKENDIAPLKNSGGNAVLLASPVYPEMPVYPDETDFPDWDSYRPVYDEWNEARLSLRTQPDGYQDGFSTFFINSTQAFLTGSETSNTVYSPLSLYMALGMSAEITDGNTRQQILDALGQSDIDTLRSHSKSIWQANYIDDGMAECILANSLWTSSYAEYRQDTVNRLADTYYSSVYSGIPGSEEYDELLRDWLNEQTDGLLSDYVSNVKMEPEMMLTLASTVNYSGKWNSQFFPEETEQAVFHAVGGDVLCDFMNSERETDYYYGDHFSSISLQLEHNGHMKLILPDEGYSPYDLLSDEQACELMLSTWNYPDSKYVTVDMSVPKFDASSDIDLSDGLHSLGITDIFDSAAADFTPLTDSADDIYLSRAKQTARVVIDEEGCKAAAYTVMATAGSAAPSEHAEFILDRPFIFEIMSDTGLPLFVGIVNTPT